MRFISSEQLARPAVDPALGRGGTVEPQACLESRDGVEVTGRLGSLPAFVEGQHLRLVVGLGSAADRRPDQHETR